jgi:GMP synthase (glutamine-hydrolysing)
LKPLALIKTGTTIPGIRRQYGDFEDWFVTGLGVNKLSRVDVYLDQSLPDVSHFSGILITGSPSMVSSREPWSELTAKWLQVALDQEVPVLGVCYGHQLLAHALGGKVGPNPRGRQIGSVSARRLESAADDPLMGPLPTTFMSQCSHSEAVLELPPGASRLATSPLSENFAVRFSNTAWGVQFHPEFSSSVTKKYIHYRSKDIESEGLNPGELINNVVSAPESKTVLTAFARMVQKAA